MEEKLLKLLLEKQNKLEKELSSKLSIVETILSKKIEDSFFKTNAFLNKLKSSENKSEILYYKFLLENIKTIANSCNLDNYNEALESIKQIKKLINTND